MALATRRLPGVRVDVAPPPAVEALPRMDVAVLVGFAATGPLHVPVVVSSVVQYQAVFGRDAPLAWDPDLGERVLGQLGAAVRAFFSNGGRRCWVIRVARVEGRGDVTAAIARANRFAVPGVIELGADGSLQPALALARCEGSWSDGLQVSSALQKRTFTLQDFAPLGAPAASRYTFRTRTALRAGDLVELGDADRPGYATIDSVRVDTNPAGPYLVDCTVRASFERMTVAAAPLSPPAAMLPGKAGVEGFFAALDATLGAGPDENGDVPLQFGAPVPATLEAGHWARWSDAGETVWMRIDRLERAPAFAGSPPALQTTTIDATAHGPAWRELGPVLPLPVAQVTRAHLLALDMRVDEMLQDAPALAGVGLTPAHPQAWWTHWDDADFYRPDEDVGAGPATEVVPSELARFPLARRDAAALPAAWLPLGVDALFGKAVAPLPETLTPLERDGLAPFDAGLFLDPDLADVPMQSIAAIADAVRYLQAPTRPLRGLHAAWSLGRGGLFNEASLLAIPDAVHLGWHRREPAEVPPPAPRLGKVPVSWVTHRGPCAVADEEPRAEPDFGAFLDCDTVSIPAPELSGPATAHPGAYRLSWTAVDPEAHYVLLESTEPEFSDPVDIFSGPGTEHVVLNRRTGNYYYQVFARVGDNRSAGSNAIVVPVADDDWVQHTVSQAGAPMEAQWLAVHRAALRMAAASGELFAALAMPRHFRTQDALRYVGRLRTVRQPPLLAGPDAFGFVERAVLSYGAMYFPWLQAHARAGTQAGDLAVPARLDSHPRLVSPDGVALGVLAARSTLRGAWIAAANEPLKDVVALAPTVPASDWQGLQDAQVNLLRTDPRGLLALSADTLSLDTDVRPINVRRLLTLLRRLALRRGVSYVFEPNGPTLRRAVERGFGAMLGELFRRGAFAGRTPQQSYRVVVDDTVNTAADAEAGRFIVELRVAPSLPMRFISVLLAQAGARLTVTEEL